MYVIVSANRHTLSLSKYQQDNVLISPDGDPLLSDFGISRMLVASGSLDRSTSVKGSTRWMAAELLRPDLLSDEVDGGFQGETAFHTKETDVWAYGMTLYVR